MDCTFASDNTSGVHPKVMEALNKANVGAAEPYGDDPWTAEAEGCFKALFGDDVDVFLVPLGTGANVLRFNRMIRSWHSILCSDMAHGKRGGRGRRGLQDDPHPLRARQDFRRGSFRIPDRYGQPAPQPARSGGAHAVHGSGHGVHAGRD